MRGERAPGRRLEPRKVVLMVEDNPDDVRLMREVLKDSVLNADIFVVEDEVQAISFLRHQPGYETAPRPDLILLDLNLPLRSGFEVLEDIKSDPRLRRIPVVVLTSSDAERDIDMSYECRANCFVTKPLGLEALQNTLRLIDQFWLRLVRLPTF